MNSYVLGIAIGLAFVTAEDALEAYNDNSCRDHGGIVVEHKCIEPSRLSPPPATLATVPAAKSIGGMVTDLSGNLYIGSDDLYPWSGTTMHYVGGVPVAEPIKGDAQ